MSEATGQAAYEAFVRARGHELLRAAWVLTGHEHDAQDLVQDTLVRLARHWERVAGEGDPMPWCRTVLHRRFVDRWRWRRRRPESLVEIAPERPTDLLADDPSDAVDLRVSLQRALEGLTPRQRAVVSLRFLHDLTEVDTARVLGCSPNTVKSQARVALTHLRTRHPDLADRLGRPLEESR